MEAKVVFYEGNGASQDIVKTVTCSAGFDGKFSPNDEARSCKLYSVPPNNPDGEWNDDVCEILVKQTTSTSGYIVPTFEQNNSDAYVDQVFTRDNGLDGKVSYLIMRPGTAADEKKIADRKAKGGKK